MTKYAPPDTRSRSNSSWTRLLDVILASFHGHTTPAPPLESERRSWPGCEYTAAEGAGILAASATLCPPPPGLAQRTTATLSDERANPIACDLAWKTAFPRDLPVPRNVRSSWILGPVFSESTRERDA